MRKTFIFSIVIICIIFFSCKHFRKNEGGAIEGVEKMRASFNNREKVPLVSDENIEDGDYLDSLFLNKILQKAIQIGKSKIYLSKFSTKFDTVDSVYGIIKTNIEIDDFFLKNKKHLLIKRTDVGFVYLNIYKIDKSEIIKVLSHKQLNLEFSNDTIQDVNGDNFSDYVVNWYAMSGCCLKAFSKVFLNNPVNNTFTKEFEFINPTFSPKEKIIRGVCYGRPGETEIYKYKWNGDAIDTLEYIYYQKNKKGEKTGKIIVSKNKPSQEDNKVLKVLNDVPNEYKKISGYNWFTGEDY